MPAAIPPIPKEELAGYFHLPLTSAAKHFGVSETFIKNLCRRYGIQRWPFRQVHRVQIACLTPYMRRTQVYSAMQLTL